MKLNKYQYAWIKKLKSGTTRKAKQTLFKSNRSCCLGVALEVCGLDKKKDFLGKTDLNSTETFKVLKLKSEEGFIDMNHVSEKWKNKIKDYNMLAGIFSLAGLNDETTMSHVEIGKFIDENREAVFKNE